MRTTVSRIVLTAALGLSVATTPAIAAPVQQHGPHKTDELQTRLTARLAAVDAKVNAAQKSHRISRAEVTRFKKKLAWVRKDSAMYAKKQGFLSAGESASYNRALDEIERKLG